MNGRKVCTTAGVMNIIAVNVGVRRDECGHLLLLFFLLLFSLLFFRSEIGEMSES